LALDRRSPPNDLVGFSVSIVMCMPFLQKMAATVLMNVGIFLKQRMNMLIRAWNARDNKREMGEVKLRM
jgi:hypothetical protein